MLNEESLNNLIARLERQRGPYMGDGVNPGFTTTEVLGFLKLLQTKVLTGSTSCSIIQTSQQRSRT